MRKLKDVKTLTEMDKKIIKKTVQIIRKHLRSAKIILYGSRARGKARHDSDYDIIVITNRRISNITEERIRNKIYEISIKNDTLISAIFVSKSKWYHPIFKHSPFYMSVMEEGILLQ